jgi:hypothetical protein
MKMIFKVFAGFCIGLFLITMVIGCEAVGVSSQEEAIYAASQLPDFKKIMAVKSVSAFISIIKVSGLEKSRFDRIHMIVYADKNNNIDVVLFDGNRPPQKIDAP